MTPLLLAALGVGMGIAVGVAAGRGWALADLDLAEVRRLQAAEAGGRSADEAWRYAAGVDAELCRVRALLQAAEEDLVEANRREMDAELGELGAAFVEEFAAAGAAAGESDTDDVDVSREDIQAARREIVANIPRGWESPDQTIVRGMAHVELGMEMMAVGGAALATMEDWGEDAVESALAAAEKLQERLDRGEAVPGVRLDYAPDDAAIEAELVEVRSEASEPTEDAELEGLWMEADAAWAPRAKRRA